MEKYKVKDNGCNYLVIVEDGVIYFKDETWDESIDEMFEIEDDWYELDNFYTYNGSLYDFMEEFKMQFIEEEEEEE